MHRIIILCFTFLVSSQVFASEKCFYDKKNIIVVKRDGESKVTFEVKGKKEASGLFFCYLENPNKKESKSFMCQGDDDSGRFVMTDKEIIFKSAVSLGSPDEPTYLSVEKSDKRALHDKCK